ncbi:putative exported protein [Granulibacter bethesdensis]|nr:putative exported protein [Granulibacter bethesdensis]
MEPPFMSPPDHGVFLLRRPIAYLAGPDVFMPDAPERAARKIAICEHYGLHARAPVAESGTVKLPPWERIFRANLVMMEACDIVIANLTPFRGASADAGTLVELGWFGGKGRPVYGYSNDAASFASRSYAHIARCPDPVAGMEVEDFGLPDNLMIPGLLEEQGIALVLPENGQSRDFACLDIFERCVALVAARYGMAPV